MEEPKELKNPEPKKEEPKDVKPLSLVEEAQAVRDEILKLKDELKGENDRREKLQSEALLGGSGGGHIETPKITEEQAASNKRIKAIADVRGSEWGKKYE